MIKAHGGSLISLYADKNQLLDEKEKAQSNVSWDLTARQMFDIELLLNGAFSPLTGYLSQTDYNSVVSSVRLANGTLWPIPINLDVSEAFASELALGDEVTLRDPEGVVIANLTVSDIWTPGEYRGQFT